MFTSHILISLSLNIIRICFMYMCIYMLIKALKSLFVCLIVNFKPADIFYHVTFNPGLVKFGGKN